MTLAQFVPAAPRAGGGSRRNIPIGRNSKVPGLTITLLEAITAIRAKEGLDGQNDQAVVRACVAYVYNALGIVAPKPVEPQEVTPQEVPPAEAAPTEPRRRGRRSDQPPTDAPVQDPAA